MDSPCHGPCRHVAAVYGASGPPAARRLLARRRGAGRLHPARRTGPATRRRTTTPTGGSTNARRRSCRAWPAMPSSRRCPRWASRTAFPRFEELNERAASRPRGWEIVAVPEADSRAAVLHAARQPQVSGDRLDPQARGVRLHRRARYLPRPVRPRADAVRSPAFADYVQRCGRAGIKAHGLGAGEKLARLYWYTVEFGLDRAARWRCAPTAPAS